jgi:parallel beta-helix repeat protein
VTAALAVPAAGQAAVVDVKPGDNAIQKAIDNRASNGDTVRIHKGRYREDVTVDKRVTLKAPAGERPVIDGRCDAQFVVDVDRNGAVVEGLKVIGAAANIAAAAVNFENIERGTARDLVVRDTCGGGPGDGAGYGVNVYRGERILVEDVNARGFSDAGVYIGLIESTGAGDLRVRDNETFGNNMGIIIEEVVGTTDVQVRDNSTHDNGKGLFVNDSDDVRFANNRIADNSLGIDIDAGSDDNVFTDNALIGNDSNLADAGTGNCGQGNSPEVFDPC